METIDITSAEFVDRVIHETDVDFNRRIIVKPIHLMQYDNTLPIIAVTLYKNGNLYSISNNDIKVYIRWGKQDHTYVRKEPIGCNSERNTFYFEIDKNMMLFFGLHTPIIELNLDSTKVVGSSYFLVEIDRNPIQEADRESVVDDTDLDHKLQHAEEMLNEAITAIDEERDAAIETISSAINTFEVGENGQTIPSDKLVVGGIFYQKL